MVCPCDVVQRGIVSRCKKHSLFLSLHRVYGMERNDASAEERIVLASLERWKRLILKHYLGNASPCNVFCHLCIGEKLNRIRDGASCHRVGGLSPTPESTRSTTRSGSVSSSCSLSKERRT